jgi:hypothetical protein
MMLSAAALPATPMRSPRVVVRGGHRKHLVQVSLAEAEGQHEAFGEAARPRMPRRRL